MDGGQGRVINHPIPTLKEFVKRLLCDHMAYTNQSTVTVTELYEARIQISRVVAEAQKALLDKRLEPGNE